MAEERIKLYQRGATSDPHLWRIVDPNGDWTHYWDDRKGELLPAVNRILSLGFPKGQGFHNYLLSVTKDEAKRVLETTGERGSRIHTAIGLLIAGETIRFGQLLPNKTNGGVEEMTLDEYKALLGFASFCRDFNPKFLLSERTVRGKDYAGTLDAVAELTIPATKTKPSVTVRALLDWKSGSGIYDDYACQVAAYFNADHGVGGLTHTGIVRVGTKHKNGFEGIAGTGYELVLWDYQQTKEHYGMFRSAKRIYNMVAGDSKSEPSDALPATITIGIKPADTQDGNPNPDQLADQGTATGKPTKAKRSTKHNASN